MSKRQFQSRLLVLLGSCRSLRSPRGVKLRFTHSCVYYTTCSVFAPWSVLLGHLGTEKYNPAFRVLQKARFLHAPVPCLLTRKWWDKTRQAGQRGGALCVRVAACGETHHLCVRCCSCRWLAWERCRVPASCGPCFRGEARGRSEPGGLVRSKQTTLKVSQSFALFVWTRLFAFWLLESALAGLLVLVQHMATRPEKTCTASRRVSLELA